MSGWGDCNAQNFADWGCATTSGSAATSASWDSKQAAPAAATPSASSGEWNASLASNNNYKNARSNVAITTTTPAGTSGWGDNSGSTTKTTTTNNNGTNGGWNAPTPSETNDSESRGSGRYHDNVSSTSIGGYQRSQPGNRGYQRAFEPHERPGRSRRPTYESSSPVLYNPSASVGAGSAVEGEERARGPRKIMGISIDEFPSATTMLDPVGAPRERHSTSGGYSRRSDYSAPVESRTSAGSWESIATPTSNDAPVLSDWASSAAATAGSSSGWGESTKVEPTTETSCSGWGEATTSASAGWGSNATSGWGAPITTSPSSDWGAIPAVSATHPYIMTASSAAPPNPVSAFLAEWQTKSSNNTTATNSAVSTTPPATNSAPVSTSSTTSANSERNPYTNAKLPSNSSWATCPFCHNCFAYPPVSTNNGNSAKTYL